MVKRKRIVIEIPDGEETVSPMALAVALKVSQMTVYRWAKRGGILPDPIPGMPSICWRPEDIEAWVPTRVPGNWHQALPVASAAK